MRTPNTSDQCNNIKSPYKDSISNNSNNNNNNNYKDSIVNNNNNNSRILNYKEIIQVIPDKFIVFQC
jgi:hypothetical protein